MLLDATNTAVLAVGILNRRRKQNTIFEGKELENAVQNTNSYCQSQEVGIGLQQSLLYGERWCNCREPDKPVCKQVWYGGEISHHLHVLAMGWYTSDTCWVAFFPLIPISCSQKP